MNYTVLIVDDQENNRKLMATIINQNTDYNIIIAKNATDVLDILKQPDLYTLPDIILLDILMPQMNGFELARQLQSIPETKEIPIIFVTALADPENIVDAFKAGGVDYISKPFKKEELLARLNTHLELVEKRKILEKTNRLLESKKNLLTAMVEEKTMKIEKLTLSLVCALENANLLNDNDTGSHIKRVSSYSGLLAKARGCNSDFIRKIKLYASLHDVGKVGIPDRLLKKPDRYTDEEFEQMKEHVRYAEQMLNGEGVDEMVRNIAVYHHEKWDGTGYLHQLKGTEIPLEARIVAVADVYDSLISDRIYRKALPENEASAIIRQSAGTHFDPAIVKAFFEIKTEIDKIRRD